jgi:SNF2 family DNA or RNA helicase
MLDELIKKYQLLDNDSAKVVNLLALVCVPMGIDDIVKFLPGIKRHTIELIIKDLLACRLLVHDEHYSIRYITDISMTIWLFPLICSKNTKIYTRHDASGWYYYNGYIHERTLYYLYSLFFLPERLPEDEKALIEYPDTGISMLGVIFFHQAYNKYIPKISDNVLHAIYSAILLETVSSVSSFKRLQAIDSKMQHCKSLNLLRTEVAIMQGNFEQAREYMAIYRDESLNYFVEAIFAFINGEIDRAIPLFDQGLKKQRRKYKNRYMPMQPEIAMFYLSACLSKGMDFYIPIFRKIADEKGSTQSLTYLFFQRVCGSCVEDVDMSEKIIDSLRSPSDDASTGHKMWKMIALGLAGQASSKKYRASIAVYAKQAFDNGYYVIAYEMAYLLTKWFPDPEYSQLLDSISAQCSYKPALSMVEHPDEWEKQLNSCFALEAVRIATQKNEYDGNARVAYRFFATQILAIPILQTRSATGTWSAGRNISMRNFIETKIDSMTEHDRRIAACETQYSSVLGRNAIYEMIGHPLVFLGDSNIIVELVAAQPVINVVKSADNSYVMECDISNPREGVLIMKETGTRYKLYRISKFQCEIIHAVSKSKPVPEQGYGKLMQLLKHFSAYVHVQSDLAVEGDDDTQIRQVDPDSRIRVQLLPMGEGLKAELFVKPFGSHPPYCKPGRGGKVLIATENGERMRVTRNLDDENAGNERIYNDIQSIENIRTDDGLMMFDNPLDSLELLDILERHQDISIVEWPEGERLKIRKKITGSDLSINVKSNTNWFELEGELRVDESTVITIGALLEMMRNARSRFVELSNGEFLALGDQLRRRLSELAAYTAESKNGVVINRFASASMMDTFDEFENIRVDKAWLDFRKRLQNVQLSDASVSPLLQAELRPYQVSAYQWMIRLSEWGAGACLADDMGLGKTVQAIAVLLHRAHLGAAMVVSPVSVMPNWISEVTRFAPSLNVRTLHNADRMATLASLEPGDLLVTSYGLLLSEEKTVTSKHWATVILDEAHAIKNYNTKTSKAAMSIKANFRLILTGTPIQNHLGEMWNLFQFINPGLLGSLSHFTETFVRPDDEKARKRLKKLITPFILRRTKAAVLEELPPKTEIVRKITLSDEETVFYEMLRRKAVESLENDNSPQGAKHLKVLAEITRLRQACCNPSLVYPEVTIESTKLSTFLEIASELKENGHRALVFSQFVTHLSIIRNALDKAGYTYRYLDGSTPVNKRELEVRNFQSGQGDFFLISLKAGGLGLNLTAADYVIHLDPWWNPAIEDQASDRAHRIGQNRPVTVYRLVAEQTIEEKIIQLHNTKRDLADSLLEGSDQSAKLSIGELMSLIKEN